MADQGKDAELRMGGSPAGTAADHETHAATDASGGAASAASREASRGGLSDHTRNRLAAQLRALYDTVAQQPVPDRFAELIAKLDDADRGKT